MKEAIEILEERLNELCENGDNIDNNGHCIIPEATKDKVFGLAYAISILRKKKN